MDAYAEVCIIPAAFTYLSVALQLVHINETHVTAELTIYMKPISQLYKTKFQVLCQLFLLLSITVFELLVLHSGNGGYLEGLDRGTSHLL